MSDQHPVVVTADGESRMLDRCDAANYHLIVPNLGMQGNQVALHTDYIDSVKAHSLTECLNRF